MTPLLKEQITGWILVVTSCVLFGLWQYNIFAALFLFVFLRVIQRYVDYGSAFIVSGVISGLKK
jgi:hypothetical protein